MIRKLGCIYVSVFCANETEKKVCLKPRLVCRLTLTSRAAGYQPHEEQQRRGRSSDEGAEAAERAAGVKLPPRRGGRWRQRSVG